MGYSVTNLVGGFASAVEEKGVFRWGGGQPSSEG